MNKISVACRFDLENKRAFYLFSLTLSTSLSTLLSFVVLARTMSVSGYGLYAYILSIITLGGIIASFGVPTLATREIARLSKESSSAAVSGVLVFGLIMTSTGTVIVGSLILAFRGVGATGTTTMSVPLSLAAVLVLYLLQLRTFSVAALNGMSQAVRAAIPGVVGSVLFLLPLLALYLLHVALDPVTVLLIQAGATIITLGQLAKQMVGVFSWKKTSARPHIQWKYWFLESLPFLGAGIAFSINTSIDVFLLGTIKGVAYTAVYQVGTKAASVLVLALAAIAIVYQPLLSRAHFSGNAEDLKRSSRTISRMGLFVAVAIATIAIPLRNVLIPLVFGKTYIEAGLVMSILMLARIVNAAVGAVGPYLQMTEKGGVLCMGVAAEAVMNIGLNLILIPAYGMIGSAVATGSSMILMNVSMAVYIYKKFRISMFVV